MAKKHCINVGTCQKQEKMKAETHFKMKMTIYQKGKAIKTTASVDGINLSKYKFHVMEVL